MWGPQVVLNGPGVQPPPLAGHGHQRQQQEEENDDHGADFVDEGDMPFFFNDGASGQGGHGETQYQHKKHGQHQHQQHYDDEAAPVAGLGAWSPEIPLFGAGPQQHPHQHQRQQHSDNGPDSVGLSAEIPLFGATATARGSYAAPTDVIASASERFAEKMRDYATATAAKELRRVRKRA